jgi:hypothetical protein
LLAACGGHPVRQINLLHEAHNAMSQDTLTVNMGALNGSRQTGSASIGDAKRGVVVEVQLQNAPAAAQPAYLARSTCTPPSRRPWHALQPVVRGKSRSYVPGIDIGRIKQGRYSLVVLASRAGKPVSCGNFQI